jgi:L-phenylalanine/L-methionine N-acetyltransferase
MEISIRTVAVKDAERISEIMKQEKVLPNIISLPSMRTEKMEERLRNATAENHEFVAEVNGIVVGFCGLHQGRGRRSHCGTLFIMVDEEYHGKGIGTSLMKKVINLADQWLLLERIELTVIENNPMAKSLYARLGFVEEGLAHGTIVQHGQYVGEYQMARYRPNGRIQERMNNTFEETKQ